MTSIPEPDLASPANQPAAAPAPTAPAASTVKTAQIDTPWGLLRRRFFQNRIASAAGIVLLALVVLAILAPVLSPQNPYDLSMVSFMDAEQPPGGVSTIHPFTFWLGSDGAGRDILSSILYGLRISLAIGFCSALVALFIGTCVGLLSAYAGGRIDALLMRVVDVQLSIPSVLVALVLLAVFGQGVDKTLLALVLVQWATFARNVRGVAMVERRKEYVEAALGQGLPARRVMFRHVLPNCMAPLIVTTTNQIAAAITLEATMSFLGIGLPQTRPSLGLLISNGFDYMLSNQYWISVFPGIALALLVISISLTGDQLRLALNPKLDLDH